MTDERVAILGLGLIGGSVGACLRRAGMHVTGFDPDSTHASLARERELVDVAVPSVRQAVEGATTVLLAAPLSAIIELLPRVDALAPAGALIMDAGSVKRSVGQVMGALPGAARMVGGHPLAGDERSGPKAASPDLFAGSRFILSPTPRTEPAVLERARQIVHALGAEPEVVDAAVHDRVLARTSHLPQALASALAVSLDPGDMAFSGPGLRDMTRLAASDPTIWRDILLLNGDEVVDGMRRCAAQLSRLAALVQLQDATGVARFVETGRERVGGGK